MLELFDNFDDSPNGIYSNRRIRTCLKGNCSIVMLDVCGIAKEDLTIDLENYDITISVKGKEMEDFAYNTIPFYTKDTVIGKIVMNDDFDVDKMIVTYKLGCLIFTIPMKEEVVEKPKIKKIEIL